METLGCAQPLPAFPGGVGQGGGCTTLRDCSGRSGRLGCSGPNTLVSLSTGISGDQFTRPLFSPFDYILMEI